MSFEGPGQRFNRAPDVKDADELIHDDVIMLDGERVIIDRVVPIPSDGDVRIFLKDSPKKPFVVFPSDYSFELSN